MAENLTLTDALTKLSDRLAQNSEAQYMLQEVIADKPDRSELEDRIADVQRSQRKTLRLGTAVVIILLALSIALSVINIGQNRRITEIATERYKTSQIILECTTPSVEGAQLGEEGYHECFEDSQARTGRVIANIQSNTEATLDKKVDEILVELGLIPPPTTVPDAQG